MYPSVPPSPPLPGTGGSVALVLLIAVAALLVGVLLFRAARVNRRRQAASDG